MIKTMRSLVLSLMLILSMNVFAQSDVDTHTQIVKETITEFMEKNDIPGVAVQLYVDGKPYSYYFGYANKDKKTPVTNKTIFEVGSISKVMTSLLLAEEIDFSKMQLNDPVTKYLPDLPPSFQGVNLQSLATHTSGLSFNLPETVQSEADYKTYLTHLSLSSSPNDQWAYSNLGIGILGQAIEQVSHKDLNQLYLKQILSPLGMQPIGLTIPKKLQAHYAQGYDEEGQPVAPKKGNLLMAAYGVKASASDMQRFLSAAIGLRGTPGKIFYPMRMTQTGYVKLSDHLQGLGWQIYPLTPQNIDSLLDVDDSETTQTEAVKVNEVIQKPTFNGDALIDKTGTTAGFGAYIALIPNKKSGIVILTNRHATDKAIVGVGREILYKLGKITPTTAPVETTKS
jgi:beta-lactamase class C